MIFLAQVGKLLDLAPGEKAQVLRELESHCAELREELVALGLSPAAAEEEAEKRMGEPAEVAARIGPIHNSSTWKSAFLSAVPYLVLGLLPFLTSIRSSSPIQFAVLGSLGVGFAVVAGYHLTAGRRSVWLASWLGASFMVVSPISSFCAYRLLPSSAVMMASGLAASGIISLTMIAALWRRREWRRLAILLVVLRLAAVPMWTRDISGSWLMIVAVCMTLVGLVLPLLFALHVFARHECGNAAQASIFLLGVSTLRYTFATLGDAGWFCACVALLVCCVVALARASTVRDKAVAATAAIIVVELWRALRTPNFFGVAHIPGLSGGVSFVLINAVPLVALVLAPFVIEHIGSSRNRASLA